MLFSQKTYLWSKSKLALMQEKGYSEKKAPAISGWIGVLFIFALIFLAIKSSNWVAKSEYNYMQTMTFLAIIFVIIFSFLARGLFTIQPNQAVIIQFLGDYVGTIKKTGFQWTFPFYSKRRISLRIRNFETQKIKVNDNQGNPIDVAAIIVWKVVDTAQAIYEVENYLDFVYTQSEAALRGLVMRYPYDAYNEHEISLIKNTDEVSIQLAEDVQQRLNQTGVEILETRISHLAYSQEIAAAMLQRQQASAVVAARTKIVEGAVGMVESALEMISDKKIVNFDDNRKAQMVSNLLIVLCSEQNTQPTLETSS